MDVGHGVPGDHESSSPAMESIGPQPSCPSQLLMPAITSSTDMSTSEPLLVSADGEGTNRQPVCSMEAPSKNTKTKILKNLKNRLGSIKSMHEELLKEKFFLESGGNLMDFLSWKKKPNISRDQYLKQHELESSGLCSVPSATTIQIPLSTVSPVLHATPPKGTTALSPPRSISFPASSPRPATRAHASFSSVYENSHEDIVMRARHEAEVMKAISELRKEGLWSASRLPKVQEPPRIKTHWDYLLEEMQWLATDFSNEKRWKINAARKLSRSVAHHHKENRMQQVKSEKEELVRLRKIASTIAKEVKYFWDSIRKIVEHKHQLILEAKRRKAMDLHLEFIVDQTAKYSDWLAQGLGTVPGSSEPSLQSAPSLNDVESILSPPETDAGTVVDEEIAVEPEQREDVQNLYSEKPEKRRSPRKKDGGTSKQASVEETDDKEYQLASDEEEMEDETTIEEEEKLEGGLVDYDMEVNVLKEEGDLPLEELLEKYKQSFSPCESDAESSRITKDDEDETDTECPLEESDYESEGSSGGHEQILDVEESGLESLLEGQSLEEASKTEAGLNDVAAAAEKFQPKGFTLDTTEVKTTVPFLLKHKLREYQHIGLDWLVAMHARKLNGILADEMGLGKTIQTIALLAHLVCERKVWGPHLIIVPTSVLLNWEFELKKWCPALKILTYFGSLKERKQKRIGWSKRNAFHVCITSYNIAVTDHRAFKQKRWNYLILDEAQNIKNFKSQRWQTLLNFNSQHRLLLTGTPLQNNLMELWSLMHFLMPMVFSSHSDFKEWFSNPLTGMVEGSQEYNDSIVKRLHQILRPFLLRRLKMEVEKQMPQKYEHIVPCHLSKRQRFLYDEYMSRAKTKDSLASGNYLSVINILMQLRKVCNHPDLFEPRPIVSPFQMEGVQFYVPSPVLSATSYNPFEHVNLDALNLRLCDYELVMDAFAAFRTRQLQTNRNSFLELASGGETTLEEDEVRGGSASHRFLEDLHVPEIDQKIQDGTMFRCRNMYEVSSRRCRKCPVYGRDLVRVVQKLTMELPNREQTSSQRWLWIGYATCSSCLSCSVDSSNFVLEAIPPVERRLEDLEEVIKRFLIYVPASLNRPIAMFAYHPHPSEWQQAKDFDIQLEEGLLAHGSLFHSLATGGCFNFPERRLIQYDCGKLQTMDGLLQDLKAGDHRALIFTQMSRMLDILEIFLNYHGWTYLRLDGSTPVQKRQFLMDQFNRDQRIFCFILSTRSGGLGVNLTGADTVIFYDSDWNPTMDAQAQDRCHRIGQTRDVHIYRLICVSTVEENILKKANQKRMLGDLAIEGGAFTTEFFKQASLRELFVTGSAGTSDVSSSNVDQEAVNLSDKQLEELLLQAEDDGDAKAASQAKAEQMAEMAEFDETFSGQNSKDVKAKHLDEETAKAMSEFAGIEQQLNAIEKYAMYFLEEETAEYTAEQLRLAEENIELAKRDWELSNLQALREEEEEKIADEEAVEDVHLTYDRPDLLNKVTLRRTSTGMWKVCSSAQNSGLNHKKEKTGQKGNSKETGINDRRVLRSGRARSLENSEQDHTSCVRPRRSLKSLKDASKAGSPRMTRGSSLADEDCSSGTNSCEYDKPWMVPLDGSDLVISNGSSESSSLNLEEEVPVHGNSAHKYPTRQKSIHQNDGDTCKDLESGEGMPMWLPPTPPSEDFDDIYVDTSLDMKYDTQSTISPAVLAAIAPFSEEDYDVFGLRRLNIDSMPVKKVSKVSKQLKEHVNVPPSLFWRRFTADTLSTKLKRLASHQKKIKSKDQFTPLLEQQPEGPEWTLNEDWILLKSINGVLEFPLSLTISVPAQIPNWSIVADITSSLGRVRRSPLQCREHLMNVVIPREDGSAKGDEHSQESRKHKSRDVPYKKSKGRKEQRTKSLVLNNSKEHTKQYSGCFDKILQASICRKQTPKFTWDTVQKPAMHSDLLKDYGIHMDTVLSPMQIAQQRADRIQSEHPRHSTGQATLPGQQPYHGISNVRSYSGSQYVKPTLTGSSSSAPSTQRSNPSTTAFSPSKITTSSLPTASSATAPVSSVAATVVKTYSTPSAGVGDLSKTLSITRNLTSQQLLLLRQSTLQHQTTTPSTLSIQPLTSVQSQAAAVQQKLSLPSGIEQLRATVASAASAMPRFAATSGGTVKGLSSGRTLQTEDVLALFKHPSMRMAATQSAQLTTKSSQVSHQSAVKSATASNTSSANISQGISTTVAQTFKAQIQALAAQHKSPLVQTKLTSEKK